MNRVIKYSALIGIGVAIGVVTMKAIDNDTEDTICNHLRSECKDLVAWRNELAYKLAGDNLNAIESEDMTEMTSTDLIIYRNELKADIKKIKNMLKEER
jgi:hypothetical protein